MLIKLLKNHYLGIIVVSLISQAYFFNRGFLTHDAGNALHAAQRVLDGDIIYKDFFYPYTPGFVFLTALSFKVFGESILSGRILMLVVSTFTSIIIYKIVQNVIQKPYLGYIAAVVFLSWGPTHINFPWPTMFALFSGFLTLLLIISAYKHGNNLSYFLSGLTALLTFLFKQNFGIAIALTNVVFYIFAKNKITHKNLLTHFLGIGIGILLFEIYLSATNSLTDFLINLYQITFVQIIINKSLTTPFVYDTSFWGLIKTIFYLSPAIISFTYLLQSIRARKETSIYVTISTFVLLFYVFGIRPVTDYTRLSVVMSLVGIPLVLIGVTNQPKLTILVNIGSITLIILGFYTALFKGYYRWETPLARQTVFLNNARAKIYTDTKYSKAVSELEPFIKQYSSENNYIFSYKHAPMFYFLFDRKNPTRYLSIARGSFSEVPPEEIISNLKQKNVKLVILQVFETDAKDPIIEFINQNYQLMFKSPDYLLLVKNSLANKPPPIK